MAVDNKYGQIDIPGIPDDEPVFVLRAQDKAAPAIIARYKNHYAMIEKPEEKREREFFDSLDEVGEQFMAWQSANADRVKLAD